MHTIYGQSGTHQLHWCEMFLQHLHSWFPLDEMLIIIDLTSDALIFPLDSCEDFSYFYLWTLLCSGVDLLSEQRGNKFKINLKFVSCFIDGTVSKNIKFFYFIYFLHQMIDIRLCSSIIHNCVQIVVERENLFKVWTLFGYYVKVCFIQRRSFEQLDSR